MSNFSASSPGWWASQVAQTVKSLPALWKTCVRSLGREDALEKDRATHSSILAWRIPWTEEPGRLQSKELQRVGHNWASNTFHQYYKSVITVLIFFVILAL